MTTDGALIAAPAPPTAARPSSADLSTKRIHRRPLPGGLINEYQRTA